MSIKATWVVFQEDAPGKGDGMYIGDTTDMDVLVVALARPEASDARLHHSARPPALFEGEEFDDHVVTVGVYDGYGYIVYDDDEHPFSVSVGASDSPRYPAHYFDFDAGSGISIDAFRAALAEFLATAKRPTNIDWRPLDPAVGDEGDRDPDRA